MKKIAKKLTLSRETLRALESPALAQVIAGNEVTKTLILTCPTNCDITMGC
jgi:hypothetical protein